MVKKLQALRAKKGFTLVELIVVIAIIGVLAAILVPTMMGMVTKSRVTSADSTASSLKDTVSTWMVELDSSGGTVPSNADIAINGKTGAWSIVDTTPAGAGGTTMLGDDGDTTDTTGGEGLFKTNAGNNAAPRLAAKLTEDYDFTKEISAVVYVRDRKAVACAYADTAEADLSEFTVDVLRNGEYEWNGKTDGVMDDGSIIGTYPKCIIPET